MSEKAESGTVLAVCVSREKGTQKQNVGSAHFIEDFGIEGDAHAGKWHRQVSLLSHDKIEALFSGRNTAYMPRCDLRDDADRKRVSSRVSYFSEDGRVHYAERRCFCKSDPRRRDQNRRYYVRRESGKFQVSGHLKDEKGRE